MEKWTRERVIREILARETAGQALTTSRRNGVDSKLYQAGTRAFGSWTNALVAAGISPVRARLMSRWPREKVLARIVSLSSRSRSLNAADLPIEYANLLKAAQQHFGTWAKAVTTAGVRSARLRRYPRWTRDALIEAIIARVLANAPLGSHSIRPRSLSSAGVRFFGSWRAALAAAGVQPAAARVVVVPLDVPSQYWTERTIIEAVLARLGARKPINASAVRREHGGLYRGGERLFGNWGKALRAAGLDPIAYKQGGRLSL